MSCLAFICSFALHIFVFVALFFPCCLFTGPHRRTYRLAYGLFLLPASLGMAVLSTRAS